MALSDVTDVDLKSGLALGNAEYQREQHATAARYDRKRDAIVIELHTGVTLSIPRRMMQGLADATPAQLTKIDLPGVLGDIIDFPALDVSFSIDPLTRGVLGSTHWMSELGKKGGAVRSPRKTIAVRQNGKKGGRPHKKTPA